MALPKIDQPLFELTFPSNNNTVTFRPFTVKEEKLLLVAQQSGEQMEMVRAMAQVVNNCVQESSFDVEKLATFDLEYAFLKIRSVSVGNIIKVAYRDNEDEQVYKFEVDLEDVQVLMPEEQEDTVKLTETAGIKMRYPPASMINNVPQEQFEDGTELMLFFVISCIDFIYDGDVIYASHDYSYKEMQEFVEGLPAKAFADIQEYFANMPKLYHKIEYENSKKNKRVIEMDNLRDFFPLR